MQEVLVASEDPQATYQAFSLSGRNLMECMLIAILLARFCHRECRRLYDKGLPIRLFVDDQPVHDAIFSRFSEQVPEPFTSFFSSMVAIKGQYNELSEAQQAALGQAPCRRYADTDRLRLAQLVGNDMLLLCERLCAEARTPKDFARLLVDLSQRTNAPIRLQDALSKDVRDRFAYCLAPEARCTTTNLDKMIRQVCLQRGLEPPVLRRRKPRQQPDGVEKRE